MMALLRKLVRNRLRNRTLVLIGVVGTLALWGLLALLVFRVAPPPRWPAGGQAWMDFALVAYVAEFLFLKAWLMAAKTRVWERLGASIVTVNACFAVAYVFALSFGLWPVLAQTLWLRMGVRLGLAAAVTWGVVELLLLTDD